MSSLINISELPHGIGRNFIAPRAMLQGAVFSSQIFRGRTARPDYSTPAQVAAYGNTRVIQTRGEQLDQNDADVYFELVRRATEKDELRIEVKSDEFLSAINRERGTGSRIWLEESIERLKNASFVFEITELPFEAILIVSVERNTDTKAAADFIIVLASEMGEVFKAGKTIIKTSERRALKQDTLAKSLHSFFSSHSKKFESKIGIEKLMKITGRETTQKSKFKVALTESIAVLKAATGWIINFDGNILKVKQCANAAAAVAGSKKKMTTTPKVAGAAKKESASEKSRWDSINSIDDLVNLELMQIILLMNEESKSVYEKAKESISKIDFDAMKRAATKAIYKQAWTTLEAREFEQEKAEYAGYAEYAEAEQAYSPEDDDI